MYCGSKLTGSMLDIPQLQDWYEDRIGQFSGTIEVLNPATGGVLGNLPCTTFDQLHQTILYSEQAFKTWSQTSLEHRSQLLHQLAATIETHQTTLATIISLENGKPFGEAQGEVTYSAGFFRWFANSITQLQGKIVSHSTLKVEVHHRAIGVCAAITPWNFPLAMIAKKCAAAVAAGCSLLCKPAEETPFSAVALMYLMEQVGFPQHLFQVVVGDAPAIGKILCTHLTIRKLSFTGSSTVGQILMQQSASNLQRLSMELGGNAPFIVLSSANLDTVCTSMMHSKFRNSGQACISSNRFIVEQSRYDEVLESILSSVESIVVGPAFENDKPTKVTLGPLISKKAVQKIQRLLQDALKKGATLRHGSIPTGETLFVAPIVIEQITPDMELWWEELFGPIIAICKANDNQQAISLANQSQHGLGAYLFTTDATEMETLPAQIHCGMVGVNTGAISLPQTPFGGVKQSGFGREGGIEGLFEYLTTQMIARQF